MLDVKKLFSKMLGAFQDMTAQEVQDFIDSLNVGGGGTAVDLVVEQGTSGIWTYRKWSSGIAECWGTYSATLSHYISTLGGYGYNTGEVNFPSDLFVEAPIANYSAYIGNSFALTGTVTSALSAASIIMYALSTTSGSRATNWYVNAVGRWK